MDRDPRLYFGDDGAPRSGLFGDIYYSLQDGLDESRAVFLRGCHLPEDWAGFEDFTVLELGFGTGLNIAALMQLWAAHRPGDGRLHVFSVEGFLMSAEAAAEALGHWPELAPYAEAMLAQWPRARRGFHVMDFPQWGVSLTVAMMDVAEALDAWQGRADAIFLDGFSPAANPGMWAQGVLDAVAARARPGARLATFTVAGAVRRGLVQAGFMVRKCPGFGRKRERLEALFTPPHGYAVARRPRRIAVVGAGIAGCAVVCQARQAGIETDIFDDAGAGAGASGNAAALVTPRLDAGGGAISSLFADALDYADGLYNRLCPEAIVARGVAQLAFGPRDADRFVRIATQDVFAEGDVTPFAAGEVAEAALSGLRLNAAMSVRPAGVLEALLDGQDTVKARITAVEGRWLVDSSGKRHGPYDAVVLAAGAGLFGLGDVAANLGLRPVRGQVEHVEGGTPPICGMAWGGYAVPLDGGWLFGATHDRDDTGTEVREADRTRNLATLAQVLPGRAEAAASLPTSSRASVRVTTRDHLPVMGEVAPGLHVLTGLGARGFCLAPLLARALVCELTGAPSPLPVVAKKLLAPQRLIASSPAYKG